MIVLKLSRYGLNIIDLNEMIVYFAENETVFEGENVLICRVSTKPTDAH
jgi:hypothetical protein